MEHLSTLDAGFLEVEDSDRHVSLAIGSISVIAGPMPDYDTLVEGMGRTCTFGAKVQAGTAYLSAGS
jgi:diacylglycerol O-acyltransferase / wax synthase